MKIFAIVVTYNGMMWYDRCLGSLRDSGTPVETIVIDNASSDGTVEYIKGHFPDVHLIESKENLGFAKANNIGIRYAIDHDADYVFLLNQDAWIEPTTIAELINTFDHNPMAGVVSPIHLNGTHNAMDTRFADYIGMSADAFPFNKEMSRYIKPVFVNAAAWLISKKCIETVGGFDTNLFVHYGEDNNYCQRVQYHGFDLVVNTQAFICHDRESRSGLTDDSRQKWMEILRQEEIAECWSDINIHYNMSRLIQHRRLKFLVACLTLKLKKAKRHYDTIQIMKKVAFSRGQNMIKQLNWL